MLNHHEVTYFSITRALRIQGWEHLDAVILAALATESPVLLVGSHGTAKTLLVERLAWALALKLHHYNASLLNYDDLVGIPLPEEGNTRLRFISTPAAVWDAEFVFFDEISRCRPDLQNKLYPIIHERRVIGMPLVNLRFRWAAMNPPSPDEPDLDKPAHEYYLGSEPLDPALTDRFPFVVPVPKWGQLSKDDRRRIITWRDRQAAVDGVVGERPLVELVHDCAARIPQVEEEFGDWITDYVICVVDLLEKAKLPESPRRANMLARSIAAVHAARLVLEGDDVELEASGEVGLLYGLPQNATDTPPTEAAVVAVHKQAWEIASRMDDDAWRQVFEESNPVRRVLVADELGFEDEDLARLITQALGAHESDARKVGLATAIFLAFRERRQLTPAAWEPLVKLASYALEPRCETLPLAPNSNDLNIWNEIKEWVTKRTETGVLADLEVNYVLGGFPNLWRRYNWKEALEAFRDDLALFSIQGQ